MPNLVKCSWHSLILEVLRYLAHFPEDLQQEHEDGVINPCVQLVAAFHGGKITVPRALWKLAHNKQSADPQAPSATLKARARDSRAAIHLSRKIVYLPRNSENVTRRLRDKREISWATYERKVTRALCWLVLNWLTRVTWLVWVRVNRAEWRWLTRPLSSIYFIWTRHELNRGSNSLQAMLLWDFQMERRSFRSFYKFRVLCPIYLEVTTVPLNLFSSVIGLVPKFGAIAELNRRL